MAGNQLEQCVETLCHKGCKMLWADIEALEKGVIPPEARSLTESERGQLLTELRAIMSVYDNSGSCCAD